MTVKRKSFLSMVLAQRAPAPRRHVAVAPVANPAMQAIWEVVSSIPRGRVSTYGTVARVAGLPGRARFAGRALKLAPAAMHLPWHRVVGAGGCISFPDGSTSYREQARRLRAEGVVLAAGRVAASAMIDPARETW